MIGLFSIFPIIREHFKSLIDDSTKLGIIILFLIIPVLVASVAIHFKAFLDRSFIQTALSVLAVLVGFTINALVLLMGTSEESYSTKQEEVLDKTRDHTVYSLVIGLVLIGLASLFLVFYNQISSAGIGIIVVSTLILYTISTHYITTLFLIPARIYKISDLD